MPDVIYHLVRPEEVYFAAANGLPARYSSARWGAQFDAEYGRYQRGQGRIYELIFNTQPGARLPDGGQQPGRADAGDRPLPRARLRVRAQRLAGGGRPRDHAARAGRRRADRRLHGGPRARPRRGLPRRLPRDRRPPAAGAGDPQGAGAGAEHSSRAATTRCSPTSSRPSASGSPPSATRCGGASRANPSPICSAFVEQHARALEDWQRDVISIVRSEQSYFLPQMRTQHPQRGRGRADPSGDLPAPVPARRPVLGVRAAQRRRHPAAPGPGQPLQPGHQHHARDHADRRPRRTRRSASAGAGPARSIRSIRSARCCATTTTRRCCGSS